MHRSIYTKKVNGFLTTSVYSNTKSEKIVVNSGGFIIILFLWRFRRTSPFWLKTCWKSPKLNRRILAHFEKMSLARWFWVFFEKNVLVRKMGQNERIFVCLYSPIDKMEWIQGLKRALKRPKSTLAKKNHIKRVDVHLRVFANLEILLKDRYPLRRKSL